MPNPKVVIVGAGSLFFGRKALWQITHSPHLNDGTLGLVDIDAERLDKMKRLAEKVIAHRGVPLRLEASTDRRAVLADADYVVLCFADRNAHFRGVDVETSAKYGIRMCSGDTIGPGGVFRTARELPEIARVCEDIRDLCPNAWIVNYINPTAVHGMALRRYFPDLRSFAICDAQWALRGRVAQAVGVPDDDKLVVRSVGPNHFTWLVEASYDGRDVMSKLIESVRAAGEADLNQQAQGGAASSKGLLNNSIAIELYDAFGALPTVLGHTKEYVRFYQRPGVLGEDRHPALKLFDVPARLEWTRRDWARVDAYLNGEADIAEFDEEFGPDPATDVIESMAGGLGKRFFINTTNGDAVANLSRDAFIELECEIDAEHGPRPLPAPALPRGVRGMCELVLDTHEITAEAVMTGDRRLLRRALLTDPLTNSIGDTDALIDELLDREADALPEGAFR